jgi:hypothetical protein
MSKLVILKQHNESQLNYEKEFYFQNISSTNKQASFSHQLEESGRTEVPSSDSTANQ